MKKKERCRDPGSNQGPSDLQSDALPTELSRRFIVECNLNQIIELLKKQQSSCSLLIFDGILVYGRYSHSIVESIQKLSSASLIIII